MTDLRVTTTQGADTVLKGTAIEAFKTSLRGELLRPTDSGYETARTIWNALIDHRPALIARCTGAADVLAVVRFAREHDLLVSIRGGGHNIAGKAVCDGGLMIDLARMKSIRVDPVARTVRAEPGVLGGEFDRETQAFGLAAPVGTVSTTGIAGLTLGGGQSWLSSKYGFAIDNLLSVDIVTADGGLRTASTTQHEDLFWAIRGAGHNFGVVTSFEFDAHPVGPVVPVAATLYPARDAGALLPAWREWAATAPDEAMSRAIFWWMPPDPSLPPALHDQDVFMAAAIHTGPAEEAQEVLQPLRELGTPLADLGREMPFRAFQSAFDAFFPKGQLSSYWKSVYLDELSDDLVDLIVRHGVRRPAPLTMLHVPMLGGAMARVDPDATAFGDRSAPFMLSVDGNWTDPAATPEAIAWVRDVVDEAERFSTRGTYLNFSGREETAGPDLVGAAYGDNLAPLSELKRRYDPGNLFRMNSNIPPAP